MDADRYRSVDGNYLLYAGALRAAGFTITSKFSNPAASALRKLKQPVALMALTGS